MGDSFEGFEMDEQSGGSGLHSVEEAGRYLESLINLEKRPQDSQLRMSLEPIEALLRRLGDPQKGLSVIHIAGSKGKGSTALYAEAGLRARGERVGVFTSPHLVRWTERFRIDGEEVDGKALARAVDTLRPHVEALRAKDPATGPTFFDATTAVALLLFAEEKLDRVILEVGLGGRLDSTNIVEPAVTCVTSIELEHTDRLGTTLAAIAGEKAGILKRGVPCVIGRLPAPARAVVRARATELGAPICELGVDFDALAADRVTALGAHQGENAAIALAAIEALPGHAAMSGVRDGLVQAVLPGRVELLGTRPWRVVDSAHTEASARALIAALEAVPARPRRLLLSVSGDKDLMPILSVLLPPFDEVIVTRADPDRSLAPDALAKAVFESAPQARVQQFADPARAARAALEGLGDDELVCATGSVYLAGIAREVFAST